ncbi:MULTISPECIES: YesK family protein [unclassified Exiguobacterium]|uniref:YesK family protein n=2 Tax=Bacillales Family XII. Incertae Sedis TaxID=539742 RepID=UPI00103A6CB9|nr:MULTISPECIES: YesK family protein [unclassified Exiguobacterium]TCI34125.1 hypothetical protein EVJ29_12955 [Exiguobacterium sp. SH4S7]TCI42128.1 hypothetical protein EVJ31_14730 [Exiguobacterium sp. SH5S32]TCI49465.1 hypothetical protein EVJ25_14705 [Exiguobacterium sp. SH1S4]TCI66822.1 hypothetical protein EVJ23_14720 [Exiguobacterium sp. SH1S1]
MKPIKHTSGGEAMAWEYYGDALIVTGMLTTVLLLVVLSFLKLLYRRRLVFPLTLVVMGYVLFMVGLVFVRGWDGMGWSLIGFSLYVIGLVTYIGVVIYHWVKARRTSNS